jgi:hypothetical protein
LKNALKGELWFTWYSISKIADDELGMMVLDLHAQFFQCVSGLSEKGKLTA